MKKGLARTLICCALLLVCCWLWPQGGFSQQPEKSLLLKAISEDYEIKQKKYLEDLEKIARWEE